MNAFATLQRLLLVTAFLFGFAVTASAQSVVFGPGLESTLGTLLPDETLTVVVTFEGDGPVDAGRLTAVEALGITRGITFHSLPVMGVAATAAQVYELARLPGVRSIWPNHPLTYYNHDARRLTGVERVRTDASLRNAQGVPFSGKGVGVVVNDSGIDGTLPDLKFGENLVENVLGTTNLNAVDALLPVTYTEGVINTDLGSGHGTHCAGTVGGTGASSGGLHAGVAPGADLIGYGSGAVIFVLDGLGGFDYALTHQFDNDHAPIRVHTNSWGSSGDFDPNDLPTAQLIVPNPEEKEVKARVFKLAQEIGIEIPKQHAHDELGIPVAEEGEDVLTPNLELRAGAGQKDDNGREQERDYDAEDETRRTDRKIND